MRNISLEIKICSNLHLREKITERIELFYLNYNVKKHTNASHESLRHPKPSSLNHVADPLNKMVIFIHTLQY